MGDISGGIQSTIFSTWFHIRLALLRLISNDTKRKLKTESNDVQFKFDNDVLSHILFF